MSPRVTLFIIVLVLALMIYALIDCGRRPAHEIRTLPKPAWLAVIFLLPAIGTALWFVMGRARVAGASSAPRRSPAPAAPDDDPEFLRQIELSRRQREREQQLKEREQDGNGQPKPPAPGPIAGTPAPHDKPIGGTGGDNAVEEPDSGNDSKKRKRRDPHDAPSGSSDDDDKK
ncbi:PLD nuclease N-terminal domain-containing protein [Saxibacter everestensis]|uniref:PLD nuclease N-terminal domain-containing protein n=1 Tax=Saxibacter everestensis TaxID=2909229 RepID=A0ABY8QPQ4_9MICO|nr:PLD nuclease N-terminal domain-containing protein [Brevibacteriaceae bacterium ZFBP1038]